MIMVLHIIIGVAAACLFIFIVFKVGSFFSHFLDKLEQQDRVDDALFYFV